MENIYILRKTNTKFRDLEIPHKEIEKGYFIHKLLADENLNWKKQPSEEQLLDEKNKMMVENGFFERDFYSFDEIFTKIEEDKL